VLLTVKDVVRKVVRKVEGERQRRTKRRKEDEEGRGQGIMKAPRREVRCSLRRVDGKEGRRGEREGGKEGRRR
jgi:hypothetical protein